MITEKDTSPGPVPVIAGGIGPTYFHNKANRMPNVTTVSASGANAGYVSYWDVPIFASDCTTVEPTSASPMAARFVFHQLRSLESFIRASLRRGAAQPHVYAKDIAELEILIPPIEEQVRIAAILDRADDLLAKRRASFTILDSLAESALATSTHTCADVVPLGWALTFLTSGARGWAKHYAP